VTADAPDPAAALQVPTARLHLYGKREARGGRKMGHLSAVAPTADEALARVQDAYDRFRPAGCPTIPRGGA
jgi:5-(carboxyamino)imidazole ribonucleotide synthase